jgi:hypothetical protein
MPAPFWLATTELALVAHALQDQHTVAVGLAIDQFAIVAARWPDLGAVADLATGAPLTLIAFERQVVLEPLRSAAPVVGASTRHRIVSLGCGWGFHT